MKKMILTLTALALAGTVVVPAAQAGGGWSTTGKVLTGVFVGAAVGAALQPAPVYYAPAPAYAYPCEPAAPVAYRYCAPAPRLVSVVPAPPLVVVRAPVCPVPRVVLRAPLFLPPPPVIFAPPVLEFRFGHRHWR